MVSLAQAVPHHPKLIVKLRNEAEKLSGDLGIQGDIGNHQKPLAMAEIN
jgi:hypothetical protein